MSVATCRCGDLQVECQGEPARVSVCHCAACQRRTGSAFSVQARFAAENVKIEGNCRTFVRTADSGNCVTYRFCAACGSTIAYSIDAWPDIVAVPLGAFPAGEFSDPAYSIYERHKHAWVSIAAYATEHFY